MTKRREAPREDGRNRAAGTSKADKRTAASKHGALALALVPGLRERLFQEMDQARIPRQGRLQYLCSMTGRRSQTARRWIEMEKPGLPDLESFAAICVAFDTDANWMLGLTGTRFALPREVEKENASPKGPSPNDTFEWIDAVIRQVGQRAEGCSTFYMAGDDMEPRIRNGTPLLVDTRTREIVGHGTYVIEYQRRMLVRNVESRIGEGLVLSCENPKYKESVIKDAAAAKRMGLKVIGRVKLMIAVETL